ncbi:MAG: aldo/keto reductase [Chitinophagaceae bacterium]|nr:aldo/keto reductase [Chitinophagaceae bacterium]
MKYRSLGKSGLQVSEVGFGCMSLSPHQPDGIRLIREAMAAGINYFDTADLYDIGENEKLLGKAIKEHRDSVIVATKGGNQWNTQGTAWTWNASPDYLRQAAEDSLRRLGTSYIDLYQLHGGTIEDPIDDIIAVFERLKEQGKIRHYGISSIRPNVISTWLQRGGLTSVMMQYSLLDRRPEETCLELLQTTTTGMLARGVLAKGLLAGKPATAFLDYAAEQVAEAAAVVKAVSNPQRQSAATAVQYVLHQPVVTCAVIGIRNQEQLDQAIAAGRSAPLSEKEWEILAAALPANQYDVHR